MSKVCRPVFITGESAQLMVVPVFKKKKIYIYIYCFVIENLSSSVVVVVVSMEINRRHYFQSNLLE